MTRTTLAALLVPLLLAAASARGNPTTYSIEPDDYANGTVLSTVLPEVTLSVVDSNNQPLPLYVASRTDNLDLAPTGDQVFGPGVTHFWHNKFRLQMDFHIPVDSISLDFAGGDMVFTEVGRMEAYTLAGTPRGTYVTQPMAAGQTETMSLTCPCGEIAYAIAYVAAGDGTFGRLDNLSFTPEPATLCLLALGGAALFARRRARR
jgi:hypothetical protein